MKTANRWKQRAQLLCGLCTLLAATGIWGQMASNDQWLTLVFQVTALLCLAFASGLFLLALVLGSSRIAR